MKNLKKLNAKGFTHVEVAILLVTLVIIGSIGSYVMLHRSHADTPTPTALCGTGFTTRKTASLKYADGTAAPAKIYLLTKYATGKACAVTMSTGSAYGASKPMKATVYAFQAITNAGTCTGSSFNAADGGTYKYYAGPVKEAYNTTRTVSGGYIEACVRATGSMTLSGRTATARIDLSTWGL